MITKPPYTGPLIGGTTHPQDLIPCFLDAVSEFAPAHYEQLMVSPFGPIPAYVQDEGRSSKWWHSEAADSLLESLIDILDEHSPEDFYFGVHRNDGAVWGWFRI
jgi:hypothetical protein